jgi:hypothetical protein
MGIWRLGRLVALRQRKETLTGARPEERPSTASSPGAQRSGLFVICLHAFHFSNLRLTYSVKALEIYYSTMFTTGTHPLGMIE